MIIFRIIFIFCTVFFLSTNRSFSEQTQVSGKVTDTLQNPLPYANILAIPESDSEDVRFAIIEDSANY